MVASAAYLAEYPDRVQTVDYGEIGYNKAQEELRKERMKLRLPTDFDGSGIDSFTTALTQQLLCTNDSKNRVFSPINVYMALSVLAETAGEDSRQQILDALGESSIDTLRSRANILWNNLYRDDGKTAILLANSLWLRDDTKYNEQTLKTLGDNYYASTFSGEMGSDKLNSALRDWMNSNTENFLSDQVEGVELDPAAVMTIVSTVYYKSKWDTEFNSAKNTQDLFHTNGGDKEVTFMNQSSTGNYYWSENFAAIKKLLNYSGMWLVLPDEGVSPEQLLCDDSFWDMVQGGDSVERKYLMVDLSLPKFDITDQTDLIDSLKALGVSDVFDMDRSNFSPLTEDWSDVWVDEIVHGARLKIDEKGAEGAAYVKISAPGAAPPPDDRVEIRFDRPFVFVLTSNENFPLFVGIVHDPQ
jgi:serine protease inhibitor